MATISNTPRPGYIWDATDNVWYPIGVGAHQHTNAADTPAVMPYSTYAAAGKNKIINGDFTINQRNFSSVTSAQYTFDRWNFVPNDGTVTCSVQQFTAGTAPVADYEAKQFARIVTASQTAAGAYSIFEQRIENVRTFAGQTMTMSFWAKAASGTPKVALEITQNFGSGGSPSSVARVYGGQVTLSTSWARYSITYAIPSISGKTVGTTDNTSALVLSLWTSAGTDFNARTGSLGIQNNTIDFWGVQAEAGSTVTAFQTATGNPVSELAACQRYYFRNGFNGTGTGTFPYLGDGLATATTSAEIRINFPVTMRLEPQAVDYSGLIFGVWANTIAPPVTAISIYASRRTSNLCILQVTAATANLTAGDAYYLLGNGSGTSYVGLSAEL
jgi:hypothetical protein